MIITLIITITINRMELVSLHAPMIDFNFRHYETLLIVLVGFLVFYLIHLYLICNVVVSVTLHTTNNI